MTGTSRLSLEAVDRKRIYDKEYLREHYGTFGVSIPKEELQHYNNLLKEKKLSKVFFIRTVMKMLEDGDLQL